MIRVDLVATVAIFGNVNLGKFAVKFKRSLEKLIIFCTAVSKISSAAVYVTSRVNEKRRRRERI